MSSKQNDTNNTIHLGNYEEFFILYMDNELNAEQMKMVDEFLVKHPDLRGEFEILMSVKLPAEEFTINKGELFAERMQSSAINEDLLLYIDNELNEDKRKIVELELASNKDYRLQHHLLLQTKLDASEEISYPNKKELYRRTERVVAFKIWMRVAAAVIIIAIASVLYFSRSWAPTNDVVNNGNTVTPEKKSVVEKLSTPPEAQKQNLAVANDPVDQRKNKDVAAKAKDQKNNDRQKHPQTILPDTQQDQDNIVFDPSVDPIIKTRPETIEVSTTLKANISTSVTHKEPINKSPVTSLLANRTTMESTPEPTTVAKGSVKGFLRKATRLIEKRTGFDPTNENGELLIGAVAVKLK